MRIETADYTLSFKRVGDLAEVTGNRSSLDCFTSGVILTGAEEGRGVEVLTIPTDASEGRLRVSQGTLALWLQYEALNFL